MSPSSRDHAARGPGDLLHRPGPPGPDGRLVALDPTTAGWRYVSYAVHRLSPGQGLSRPGDADEVAVIVLEGRASIMVGPHGRGERYADLGTRSSVFEPVGPPVVLVEPGRPLSVEAVSECLVAIASAPGGDVRLTRLIDPATMRLEERGRGMTARTVRHLLPPAVPAGRLLLVEVMTPGGHWSSYPPHKHDTEDPPREAYLEEIYHYRFARPEGFAMARIYTADGTLDVTLSPHDGDLVAVPRGYHPVGMPAGYDGWYLNAMAGPRRAWQFSLDPDHAWLLDWDPATLRGEAGAGQA